MDASSAHVRPATRADVPGIVSVSNSSTLPGEDFGFGGGMESPFHDVSTLVAVWQDANLVQGEGVWVAEMGDRIVGCVTVEDRGCELELVNINVPLQLQGRGVGTLLVRSLEERARGGGETSGYPRHKSQRGRRGLEVASLVATLGVQDHSRRGERMGPVNRAGGPRGANAEGSPGRMSFLERVHAGTVDAMDRGTEMEVREHLVTIRLRIQACPGSAGIDHGIRAQELSALGSRHQIARLRLDNMGVCSGEPLHQNFHRGELQKRLHDVWLIGYRVSC